jgi:hypothetical protein
MTINELIATSSVHAFNSGVESGRALEQERIIKVLQDKIKWQKRNGSVDDDMDMGILIGLDTAIEIAKGKDNDQ